MMVIVMLSILQSIVCQLIENTIDQQLWLATIDLPNCGTSSKNLILHFPTKISSVEQINFWKCSFSGQLKI